MGGISGEARERTESQSGSIQTVTSVTFDTRVLQADGPIAVEFMSYGCAHCGVLEPLIQRAAAALKGKETLFRVNVAVDEDLARRYDITGTPTVVMFLKGLEVARVEGPSPSEQGVLSALMRPFVAQ